MNIRFYHARILPLAEDMHIFEGELWVCGDRIAYLGAPKPALDIQWDREIDVHGDLLMPGFKDAHTHSAMTFLRSFADDLPLDRWLKETVFPMEAKLTDEDVYHLSRLAILEYLTSGITANLDMYRSPHFIAKASQDCGFRTVICGAVNDFLSSVEETAQAYAMLNRSDSLVSYVLGFHAEYTTSQSILQELAALAQQNRAPVYTHVAETQAEVDGCIARHGMTPVAYLTSLGLFNFGGGAFHCVHMTQQDMTLLRQHGVYAVTNPASNSKLASGIAPLCQMQQNGLSIALGTDGPASNNCLDMFREMFLATALQKLHTQDATALCAADVLRMATVVGAHAMGLNDSDCLAPGKKADLIRINLQRPNMQPITDIVKNIVFSGSKDNVRMTMVNGCILYEDGEFHIGTPAEEIYRQANACVQRMRQ